MDLKAHPLHAKYDKELSQKTLADSQTELEQALVNLTLKESSLEEEKRKAEEREDNINQETKASAICIAKLEKKVGELEDELKASQSSKEALKGESV